MKNKISKTIRLTFILCVLISSGIVFQQCSNQKSKTHREEEKENGGHNEEIVQLTDEEMTEFGIELATAGSGKLEQHVDLTGEIVIDPNRLAHIFPRFPGIVKEVRKKIGDFVKKGDVMAIIESNESLAPYEVKTQIAGTVIDMHLTLGEVIGDGEHSFLIADLSKVWINLSVYQKDLFQIQVGQKAVISAGPNTKEVIGKISYISPIVDENTRTATARVILNNGDGYWRPGLFVNAKVFIGDETVAVYAPKTALETFENRTVVFVKHEDGFEPQVVTIGRSNTKSVEIVAGLKPGQVYVSKGGFTLKAELQKDAFSDGHEH